MDERERLIDALRRAFLKRDAGSPDLREESLLARRLHALAAGDPDVVDDVDLELDAALPLHAWIHELPFDLAEAGRVDDAVELCASYAPLIDPAALLGARARILAETGRADEARAQADDLLVRYPASVDTLVAAGLVFERCGAADRAEGLYRRALELAGDDADAALVALDQLAPLLRGSGRAREAAELEAASGAFRDALEDRAERIPDAGAALFGDPDLDADLAGDVDTDNSGADDSDAGDTPGAGSESRAVVRLLRRLFTFGAQAEFEHEQAAALREWFGDDAPGASLDEAVRRVEDEAAFAVFVEWLLLDRKGDGGATLGERFVERRRTGLTDAERAVMPRLAASHLGLYEVESVREGVGFTVRDLLEDVSRIVAGPAESAWIVVGDVFAARLLAVDGTLQTTGSVVPLDGPRAASLRTRFERRRGAAGWAETLKAHAPEIVAE